MNYLLFFILGYLTRDFAQYMKEWKKNTITSHTPDRPLNSERE